MDRRLIEVAREGDVDHLLNLIKDDRFLMRAAALSSGETPLHIACMSGNLNIVTEVLNLSPEFAKELSHDGFSPLHIAAANGDLEIVKELLKIDPSLCMVKGKERRIPLHCAVIKGRIQVIQELLSACEDSIREVTARGETCLHLAVKNYQFEAFKSLAVYVKTCDKADVLNEKDAQGNTILHLAVARKQYEVVELMLDENFVRKDLLEVNSLNKRDLTPLAALKSSEGGDDEIEEMLSLAGASMQQTMQTENPTRQPSNVEIEEMLRLAGASMQQTTQTENPTREPSNVESRTERPQKPYQKLQDYFKFDKAKETPSDVRSTLLVVAVLITTATYQAILSPPGGVWQEDFSPKNATEPPAHTAGKAVMGTQNSVQFGLFMIFNSIGFFTSVLMICILTFGLPLKLELGISLLALTVTYDNSMSALADGRLSELFAVISIATPLLIGTLSVVARNYSKRSTFASQTA